ncbi:carboxylesterase/lipase family protein [Neorhizobium galegae]|uniref:carboxylesterase/lipase family protein n=1 Tax=Neorhizobium galegae TaxID=399 RepID=UPI0006219053|nr:carboxylesterase family protein [Neorhizobium galegae]KAB1122102.1 carboxylesterase family protein [Neorhizobium galegae]MCQ1810550.1 carboxylesterase family protein [Neorhizobium galegae]CDZ62053.1 Carboxylesterase type B [Neorhizobium galegae bv. orientalis]
MITTGPRSSGLIWLRRYLQGLGLVAVIAAAPSATAQVVSPLAPVTTESGHVAGQTLKSGVKAWLGIPYAAPPVQDLRWRPPQPIFWEGVWNADRLGPECIQVLRPHDINHYFGEEPTSENCLYMNIWSPGAAEADSKLPVIVFLYGGGGTIGSSGMDSYKGEELAKRGAVFVNFNYRVGLMGFMAHPELTAEQGGHSGNYAYLDQNAALKWIKSNIAKFGGDSGRVVIMGQSAGARSVTEQIFSPLSKGLFSGAVMSSGCTWNIATDSLAEGEKTGLKAQELLGAKNLAAMRNIPADKILAIQSESQVGTKREGVKANGVIDGYFTPKSHKEILATGEMSDVPIIAHYNRDETNTPFSGVRNLEDYNELAERIYGDKAKEFLKLYPAASDDDVAVQATQIALDSRLAKNARDCAALQVEHNKSPAYVSMFSRKHSFAPGVDYADIDEKTIGAYHTADIPFWFGTLETFNKFRQGRAWTDSDRALSEKMMASLISFAKTGDPKTSDINWKPWSTSNDAALTLDAAIGTTPSNPAGMDFIAANPLPQAAPGVAPGRVPGTGPRD